MQSLWKTAWQFLKKIKCIVTIWSSNSTSGDAPKRTENRDSNRYLFEQHYSSYKSWKPQHDEWMVNKMCYIHSIVHHSALKNEGNSETCFNGYERWRWYTKWNKSVTKGQILHDSTYMRYLEQSNQKAEYWLQGVESREPGVSVTHGYRASVWESETFWKRMMVMVAQQRECTQAQHCTLKIGRQC